MRLNNYFYKLPATESAPMLLGKLLCRRYGKDILKYRITQTECYYGESDTACHAHKGKTKRTSVMYEPGGCAYVYLCYGMHSLLNIVTGEKDNPEAILIRCVEGYDGPGKLTKVMHIDREFNGENLITSDRLWIEDDGYDADYETAQRVGIGYADEKDQQLKWRYILKQK